MMQAIRAAGILIASSLLLPIASPAQNQSGDWSLTGADPGQSGWQKGEVDLKPEDVADRFRFLWKIKLGPEQERPRPFSEPLLAGRLINARGFKDLVYWSSADTLYAVDSELGSLVWKTHFDTQSAAGCGLTSLPIMMEPPVAINFRARRNRTPGTPRPAPEQPTPAGQRKLGVPPGGGYFGMKGIYVLTADGMLHEQVITTGADFAPPVRFLPAGGSPSALNFSDKAIYTATRKGCGNASNGVWSIDLASATYQVAEYNSEKVRPLALTGPVLTSDGSALIVTSPEPNGASADVHPASVISLSKQMKVEDWYTPQGGMAMYEGISPATFTYKEKAYVVAPGRDGRIALLDAASLGGADHQTPLAESPPLTRPGARHGWDGFAAWQDKDGTEWVYASIDAAIRLHDDAAKVSGEAMNGGIVAFKIVESDGKLALVPAWISRDMINPAPPRIANGVVIALAGGNASTHATLYVLNAASGEQLYSSKDEIPTYTQRSGVAIGDSHAFFSDRNNVLYSFGIGLEH